MILRNLTSTEQTVRDGPTVKTVAALGLVAVSNEMGAQLISASPETWSAEQPLIPPPP